MVKEHKDFQLLFCTNSKCISKILSTLIDIYKTALYSYNTLLKSYGLYLKPLHIVVKKNLYNTKVYHYYGRYWYKVIYRNGKLKWVYVGKNKPSPELPDPPANPLLVIKITSSEEKDKSCIYIDKLYKTKDILKYVEEAIATSNCVKFEKW